MTDEEMKEFKASEKIVSKPGSAILVKTYEMPASVKKRISDAIQRGSDRRREEKISAYISLAIFVIGLFIIGFMFTKAF